MESCDSREERSEVRSLNSWPISEDLSQGDSLSFFSHIENKEIRFDSLDLKSIVFLLQVSINKIIFNKCV